MYKEWFKFYLDEYRFGDIPIYIRGFFIFGGVFLVSISLEFFLVENYMIDGGMVGLSIIISHLTDFKVSSILLLLNLPFLLIGYFFIGKRFLVLSLFSIFSLAFETSFFEQYHAITNNPFLVIIIGGICLGLGVGLIIHFGGSLDGCEVLAILLSKQTNFSIGQYILFFNFFIYGSAIFVFGLKESLYSLATFFVAYKTIDLTINYLSS